MDTTSTTLLRRLHDASDHEAWDRFIQIYTPLIYCCVLRYAGRKSQAVDDTVQEVFLTLLQTMRRFAYDREQGQFRNYLRALVRNKCYQRWRNLRKEPPTVGGNDLDAVDREVACRFEEDEFRQYVTGRICEIVRSSMNPIHSQVFHEFAVRGRAARNVARQFGISTDSVFKIKSRGLRLIRQELQELEDLI